ncbi:hypothetical protein QUA43_09870 [Microcoleus sp. N9_B4]|uniref:hypothetical protein n=1 Tax=Microcoleus sp. N9_B4 TaxID=3055386 RepID=UPI002FD56606
MTDSSPGRKKKKLTIAASKKGVETAEKALLRLGFGSKSNFARSKMLSRSTVTKFFTQCPILYDSFKVICDSLQLKWEEILETTEESINFQPIERQLNPSSDIEEGVKKKMLVRQVNIVEKISQRTKTVITLKGDIDSISNIQVIAAILKEHGGDTIQITDIQEGSIKLIIEGSQEDIERLLNKIQSGELTELDGFPVEDAQILAEKMPEEMGHIEIIPQFTGVKSMQINRLSQIEKNLKLLRDQQHALEREAILTTGLPKIHAEQRLQEEIKPKIREYEKEYWQVLAQQTKTVEIPEPEAEIIVAEIVEEVGQIEVQRQYPDEVVQILQEIRDKLNQPGQTAAAKLKGVISSIPPFIGISYEAELDTENFFQRHFPTFQKGVKALAKKS